MAQGRGGSLRLPRTALSSAPLCPLYWRFPRLASGCWPALPGGLDYPLGSIAEFQSSLHLIPPAQACPGALKTIGGFRRTRYIGLYKTRMAAYMVASAYTT